MNNDNTPKVVDLKQPPDALAAAGENLKRNLDTLVAHQVTIARLRRASYLALIDAGFTEAQALELCCK
jgi:tRNA A58 N-methylase Trm61